MINSWQLRRRRRCRNPKQRSFFFFLPPASSSSSSECCGGAYRLVACGHLLENCSALGLPIPFWLFAAVRSGRGLVVSETSQHRKAGLLLSWVAANRMQSLKELETNLATYNEQLHQVSLLLHLNALPPSAPSWFSEGIWLQLASLIPLFFRLFFVLDGIEGLCGLAPM